MKVLQAQKAAKHAFDKLLFAYPIPSDKHT